MRLRERQVSALHLEALRLAKPNAAVPHPGSVTPELGPICSRVLALTVGQL